jgi:predicted NUDIX family NTP pyrophosphohydrolase
MIEDGESPYKAACREFAEETSFPVPADGFIDLGTIFKARSNKTVHAWAFECGGKLPIFCSNCFKMEWPPKSGKLQEFTENDRGEFFDLETARRKINPGEAPLLERLIEFVGSCI